MRLVHSISLYDENTKQDIIYCNEWTAINKRTTVKDVCDILYDTHIDYDFMLNVVKIYLKDGLDSAKDYAKNGSNKDDKLVGD